MPIRFMTDANAARRHGNSWNGAMRFTSHNTTMAQRDHAFRNIVNTVLGVRDQLLRDATKYEALGEGSEQAIQLKNPQPRTQGESDHVH